MAAAGAWLGFGVMVVGVVAFDDTFGSEVAVGDGVVVGVGVEVGVGVGGEQDEVPKA